MVDSKIPRIIEERSINDKIWQVISFFVDSIEKFDVVCFDKSNTNEVVDKLISSKKRIKTFGYREEALKFIKELS
ncbi:hypothetical protein A3H03_02820 [Candidatus Kuenenbacteria bacterium RIFCSPLOWO2_12_FULL_42_13]|uniref:Uncharacterized protein n=4 Tax=Candidatus Kueneniibacteriota TaxID=1752740 RepID=A0A0G1AZM3_9BACT|nr:MAG: hypothetical protein UV02_C0067G0004 [Candidatus Kuenenbacteria bacterium GW2011_GWA2_42_15]OGG90419.1 MAG: hypothetical protein A3H55_03570 [Candidatus Kuenenbacteria bacterium RIFCSPLOWO2_02_FULL_42_16]OGG91894.1 MAG: hypothetical protein A3H03_02820 [Candidatus Kuenenbacteria bacterium RIFCSPLOWO2_12_FULL_42_13]OGG95866.1 MAG: hypothetical protein A2V95_01800 [Candidatus Kuenenbacteria bacterium RBG_16_41_7]